MSNNYSLSNESRETQDYLSNIDQRASNEYLKLREKDSKTISIALKLYPPLLQREGCDNRTVLEQTAKPWLDIPNARRIGTNCLFGVILVSFEAY